MGCSGLGLEDELDAVVDGAGECDELGHREGGAIGAGFACAVEGPALRGSRAGRRTGTPADGGCLERVPDPVEVIERPGSRSSGWNGFSSKGRGSLFRGMQPRELRAMSLKSQNG